jgi:hypothetical protein
MHDSVSLINEFCALDICSEEEIYRIKINVKHLEVMLDKQDVSDNIPDKSVFINAINLGKAKVG